MASKRKTITNKGKGAGESIKEKFGEVHVCCYEEGGYYFAADLSGFIIEPFHEVGELCDWILNHERGAVMEGVGVVVVHAHKLAVMRPHPVFEDLDKETQQRLLVL